MTLESRPVSKRNENVIADMCEKDRTAASAQSPQSPPPVSVPAPRARRPPRGESLVTGRSLDA